MSTPKECRWGHRAESPPARNMGSGPSGLASMNLKTGEVKTIVVVGFQIGHVQTNPWVAVGPGGVVDVAWWDQRNDYPGTTTAMGNVYFAQSTDGGATFPTNRRITDRSINEGVGLYSPARYLGFRANVGATAYLRIYQSSP